MTGLIRWLDQSFNGGDYGRDQFWDGWREGRTAEHRIHELGPEDHEPVCANCGCVYEHRCHHPFFGCPGWSPVLRPVESALHREEEGR